MTHENLSFGFGSGSVLVFTRLTTTDTDADAERLDSHAIFEAVPHAPGAHPMTHGNLGLWVRVAIAIGIAIGIGFCSVGNCR
jgi:hypothetical protein